MRELVTALHRSAHPLDDNTARLHDLRIRSPSPQSQRAALSPIQPSLPSTQRPGPRFCVLQSPLPPSDLLIPVDEQGAPSSAQAAFPGASCTLRQPTTQPLDARQPTPTPTFTPTPRLTVTAHTLAAALSPSAAAHAAHLSARQLFLGPRRREHSRPPQHRRPATPISFLRRCLAA